MSIKTKEWQTLAENVKTQRLKRAWTQEQLAEICSVNVRTIQRVEKLGQASLETKKALAAAFNISVTALFAEPETSKTVKAPSEVQQNVEQSLRQFLKARLGSFSKNLLTLCLAVLGVYILNVLFYPEKQWQYRWAGIWLVIILVLEIRAIILKKFSSK